MLLAITASKIYSTLGNNNSLVPLAIKDVANSLGLTTGSYITGDKLEGKDRFIDEFGTQAIWLFGIPAYKKLIDLTLYKLLKIDPKFDARNLSQKRAKVLEKSIQYADKSISGAMKTASKNPKFTKALTIGKFAVSTLLTIGSYSWLTKYRHKQTEKSAQKEILAEMQKNEAQKTSAPANGAKPTNTPQTHVNSAQKQVSFKGGVQDFVFNPVKNLMILDGAITGERLANSRNKQEFIGYTIKEGTFWAFMYFASKPIQKVFEKAVELNSKHPASIDLDARVIESEALEQAFKNGTLKESTQKVLNLKTQEELLDFIHNNPEDFTVKMAKMSDVLPTLKQATQADNIDYRQFIDLDEFKGVAQKLNKLGCKFENFKQTDIADKSIEIFLKAVKKLKRMAILGNIGICIGVLGVIAPALMVALRKLDKNNQGFQVKEDLKKQMAFNGKI